MAQEAAVPPCPKGCCRRPCLRSKDGSVATPTAFSRAFLHSAVQSLGGSNRSGASKVRAPRGTFLARS
eukprot:12517310-Alexandrium_andersonii.AAC.1